IHVPSASTRFPYTTLFRSVPVPSFQEYRLPTQRSDHHETRSAPVIPVQLRLVPVSESGVGTLWVFHGAEEGSFVEFCRSADERRSEEHTSELQSPDQLVCP